jgi:hypothetical protein
MAKSTLQPPSEDGEREREKERRTHLYTTQAFTE